jgi:hypothetical protein
VHHPDLAFGSKVAAAIECLPRQDLGMFETKARQRTMTWRSSDRVPEYRQATSTSFLLMIAHDSTAIFVPRSGQDLAVFVFPKM